MTGTVVLVNPTAGSGRAQAIWDGMGPGLGSTIRTVVATSREEARIGLRAELERGASHVVCIGGDGTVNLAAECVFENSAHSGSSASLGIVPAGTGSDLASSLGLPERPQEALRVALGSGRRPIDLIEVLPEGAGRRVAVNVAAAGLPGRVDQLLRSLPRGRKKRYLPTTLRALLSYRAMLARVTIDNRPTIEGRFYLVSVANGPTFGRGMRVAPLALVDDGLLDFILVGDLPRWQLPWRMPQLVLGWHLRARWVNFVRGERLDLEILDSNPLPVDLDGEMLECSSVRFAVRPKGLEIAIS